MWSAYLTAKLFFLLLLVEASFGRYINPTFASMKSTYLDLYLKGNLTINDFRITKETLVQKYRYPNGNVTIRWDMMNQNRHNYTLNITIFNYLKNHDIEGPWELKWTWNNGEILLNTLGAKSMVPDNKHVTVVDLPSSQTEQIIPNCCKGGLITSWFKEGDLAKSSSSFQIIVAPIMSTFVSSWIRLTTPGSRYNCGYVIRVTNTTPGYLSTYKTYCDIPQDS